MLGGAGVGVCITRPLQTGGAREDEVAGSSWPLPCPTAGSRHVGLVVAGVASISEEPLNSIRGKFHLHHEMHFLFYPWHVF